MKKLIFLLFPLLFLNFTCDDIPPVVGTICDITKEICYYSEQICSLMPQESISLNSNDNLRQELNSYRNLLQVQHSMLKSEKVFLNDESYESFKRELWKIRNDLKAQLEELKCNSR